MFQLKHQCDYHSTIIIATSQLIIKGSFYFHRIRAVTVYAINTCGTAPVHRVILTVGHTYVRFHLNFGLFWAWLWFQITFWVRAYVFEFGPVLIGTFTTTVRTLAIRPAVVETNSKHFLYRYIRTLNQDMAKVGREHELNVKVYLTKNVSIRRSA